MVFLLGWNAMRTTVANVPPRGVKILARCSTCELRMGSPRHPVEGTWPPPMAGDNSVRLAELAGFTVIALTLAPPSS